MNRFLRTLIMFSFCNIVHGNSTCVMTAFPSDTNTNCCGYDSSSKLTDGGTSVLIGEHPWVAILEHIKDGRVKTPCGGALISGNYVLTAAHCVTGRILQSIGKPENILLGEYDTSNDGPDCVQIARSGGDCTEGVVRIPIDKTIPHPEYMDQQKNDIALIRMTRVAPYTDFIRPICLPTVDLTKESGTIILTKAGWGQTDVQTPNFVKIQVHVPFVPQDKCQAAFTSDNQRITLWKGQICAGGENFTDFCKGDSGLPLTYNHGKRSEVVGIFSLGTVACAKSPPTIYTHVFEYIPWIKNNIVA